MAEIKCLDDVLPWVEGRKDFVVKRAAEYTAVDYLVALPDTFEDPRRLELRGVKFYPDGRIMARPLHKFFNLGEKQVEIDFASSHAILDKLDGSMVHPTILPDGSLRLMTRMGLTDVASRAEQCLSATARAQLGNLLQDGCTPILEFTSPANRIVIEYGEPCLTLLAIRNTITGQYQPREMVEAFAGKAGLPVVKAWGCRFSGELVEHVKGLRGAEGVVVQFASGLWLKIKADDYLARHKAKDGISHEKNVVATILGGIQDDIKPLLDAENRARFERYETGLLGSVLRLANQVADTVASGAQLSQREFAVEHLCGVPDWLRSCAFTVRAGNASPVDAVRQFLRKRCGTQADVDSIRSLIGTTWQAQ